MDEDQTQAVVDQAFQDWKDLFSYSGGCGTQVVFKINNIEIDLDTLSAPHACGGDVTIEMVVTSACGSDSCESEFIVIAAVDAFILALPGGQNTCSNAPSPPTWADVPAARSAAEIVSQFLISSLCVDPGQINVTHIESGPTVNGNAYTFVLTYYVTAPNSLATDASEIF